MTLGIGNVNNIDRARFRKNLFCFRRENAQLVNLRYSLTHKHTIKRTFWRLKLMETICNQHCYKNSALCNARAMRLPHEASCAIIIIVTLFRRHQNAKSFHHSTTIQIYTLQKIFLLGGECKETYLTLLVDLVKSLIQARRIRPSSSTTGEECGFPCPWKSVRFRSYSSFKTLQGAFPSRAWKSEGPLVNKRRNIGL